MKVFKFGGASVSNVERIKNVGSILKNYVGEKLVVVVSAMGKTTNALEKVADAFYKGDKENALLLFENIKKDHINILKELNAGSVSILTDFFTEVEWLLHDKPVKEFDYYYDQIVCIGELLSTSIVSAYLNSINIPTTWVDVRDIIRTDDNFRNGVIDWNVTGLKINEVLLPLMQENKMILTQGFIGSTDENESTTLGREGSDYSAAVFANLLNAESQTIWKDVPGVMNADPKQYKEAELISELTYREVIEMAYYGAQVIHPKTIKPLQNKGIPLIVRSFIDMNAKGTLIHGTSSETLPPIIVYKENQVLVTLTSKDYSFVSESLSTELYSIFEKLKSKPNLTQNTAISLLIVMDDFSDKVDELALMAAQDFDVHIERDLLLLTIRHYNDSIMKALIKNVLIVLKQQTPETIQVLMKKAI
jgi:aspartate kinase